MRGMTRSGGNLPADVTSFVGRRAEVAPFASSWESHA